MEDYCHLSPQQLDLVKCMKMGIQMQVHIVKLPPIKKASLNKFNHINSKNIPPTQATK